MFKVSQLIALPIINIYNLKLEGYVEKIHFNSSKKSLEYIKVYDEKNETYKAVKFNDILTISNSAIFIKNSSKITLYENAEYLFEKLVSPINAKTYIINEDYVGVVKEIEVNKQGLIENIELENNTYERNKIIGFSNDIVLISCSKSSISRYKPYSAKIKTSISNITNEPIVTILNNPQITPQREITNYNFLLNRKILKDIKNQNGEIIAKQNSVVTLNLINKLKYYGKLKELTLNSK